MYELLLEYDLNPFILFDFNGKIKKTNSEAEFLLNFVSSKELFNLTTKYAPKDYGVNYNYIHLEYDKVKFYAILVAYLDDNEIALRLFKSVRLSNLHINKNKLQQVNIFSLIDISKNTILLDSNLDIKEIYDVSIPEMKLDIEATLFCLNECFSLFKEKSFLEIRVFVKIGEYEIIDNKKYKILVIEFISDNIKLTPEVEKTAFVANFNVFVKKNKLVLEFAIII